MTHTRRRRQFLPSLDVLDLRAVPAVFTASPSEYPTTPSQDATTYPLAPPTSPSAITPPTISTSAPAPAHGTGVSSTSLMPPTSYYY